MYAVAVTPRAGGAHGARYCVTEACARLPATHPAAADAAASTAMTAASSTILRMSPPAGAPARVPSFRIGEQAGRGV